MRQEKPLPIRRHDYLPPAWWVDRVDLDFDLRPDATTVTSLLQIRRNPASTLPHEIVLDGEDLELLALEFDGTPVREFTHADQRLRFTVPAEAGTLRIVSRCAPNQNTALSGLYTSNGNFFTQCEAEGFRRITFFPDRPDVMARYRVRLAADRAAYPVLLANGNLIEHGALDDTRHYAVWDDPFPKPSYLFALVAGKLVCEEARLRTGSGREVLLQVWVEDGNLDKTHHAMESLKASIRWDEERYGLELDLDRFMIVAVSDFNMGAMENKGLNIFNTKYVLANPEVATDLDFAGIESVVGHEYFHNWTGNRVTCRDWFQLSLKEGLTVFRDQEFSMDMMSGGDQHSAARAVKRIDDVRTLRAVQFPEDAGPMSHPIRPDEYEEINNFYTATVYEKGAEVVRMQQTILGREGFRRGMDEYFRRHDGQAVTCDDFVAAMEAANGADLGQFREWYAQSGTPRLRAHCAYDAAGKRFTLTLAQSNGAGRKPLHVPVAVGLVGPDGADLALQLEGEAAPQGTTRVLHLKAAEQSFVFVNVNAAPVPSVLRDFSAPVQLAIDLSDEQLAFLMANDSDAFNRWEAGQRLMLGVILAHLAAGTVPQTAPQALVDAFRATLQSDLDPAFVEVALSLPGVAYIAEQVPVVDPTAIAQVRDALFGALAHALEHEWLDTYERLASDAPYSPDAASTGRRALRNLALAYLVETGAPAHLARARSQYVHAGNMTDRFAALSVLADAGMAAAELADFYARYANDALVIDKWFTLQATARRVPDGQARGFAEHVVGLLKHAAFNLRNPNRARSVILQFCNNNPVHFHDATGFGYAIWADYVLKLDELNPQVASRLARALDRWRRFTPNRQALMRAALERVAAKPTLSRDAGEVIGKALG